MAKKEVYKIIARDWTIKEVEGRRVTVLRMPCFIHGGGTRDRWTLSEMTTGTRVTGSKTQQDAIDMAKDAVYQRTDGEIVVALIKMAHRMGELGIPYPLNEA